MHKALVLLAGLPVAGATAIVAAGAVHADGCAATSSVNACDHSLTGVDAGGSVLRFLDVQGTTADLDVGDPGSSPGDTLFFDNTLRDRRDTQTLGRFVSRCTQVTGTDFHCQGSLLLEGATIELATTTDFDDPGGIVAAVVGGTGRYQGASGEARISPTATAGTSQLVVHLSTGR